MRPLPCLAVALVAGCAHPTSVAPAARRPALYDVAVVTANGERTASSVLLLEVDLLDDERRIVATRRTEGVWEEQGHRLSFDSDAPRSSDPWYLHLQHLVASVPATVAFDAAGAPVRIDDEPSWERRARERIYAAELPVQALTAGERLLDAEGVVADLRRDFPGAPPETGEWVREERLGGLPARRVEVCGAERAGASTTWTCEGHAEGPTDGVARLHEVKTQTVLEADADGLVRLESTWSGTLVMLDPEGHDVIDRPIAERRLVARR